MAWIEIIEPQDAKGLLERLYAAAVKRVGKVFQVVQIQSQAPRMMRASIGLYQEVMFAEDSPLSRAERELVATVVSKTNDCFY